MILHILRKDTRRLWPLIAALALCHLLYVAIQLELLPALGALRNFSRFLGGSAIGGPLLPTVNIVNLIGFFLAVMAVQLDPLPGDRQDWLVRPVRRRDLLLAKLLFVAAIIHLPMLVADMSLGLGFGASPSLTFSEAAWRNLYQFLVISIPGMLAGTLTRGIGHMLALVTAVLFGTFIGAQLIAIAFFDFPSVLPDMGSTVTGWSFRALLFLGVAIAILGLQYFRRTTAISRLLFVGVIVVLVASQMFVSRRAALAMQDWVLPPQSVSLTFAPGPTTSGGAPGVTSGTTWPQQGAAGAGRLLVPLRVDNLAPGRMLIAEYMRPTVIAPDGKRTVIGNPANRLTVVAGKDGAAFIQAVTLSPEAMDELRGIQGLRLEMEYTMAVLQPETVHALATDGATRAVADGLRCTSRLTEAGAESTLTMASLRCLQTGQVRKGITAALPGNDAMEFLALPTDAPYKRSADMLNEIAGSVVVRDSTRPPALTITLSRPLGFVVRRVVIEDFRPGG